MYISADIPEKIKELAKAKKVAVKTMLSDLNMGPNTMSNFKTSMPKCDTLARIADYLDCSVDYLLGRTDNPKSHLAPMEDVEYAPIIEKVEIIKKKEWEARVAAFKARREQERQKRVDEYIEKRSAEILYKMAGAKLSDGLEIFDGAEVIESTDQHNGRKAIKQEG